MNLAAYCGAHSFYLKAIEDKDDDGPIYFLGETREFDFESSSESKLDLIFDEIYSVINIEPEKEDEGEKDA